ncbi:MAG TPA: phosphonate C-P lyase system protein PhnH [Negativicutes bacterium]|nr:phosphonate C-P lyase system protein PhnH [Negativicutes bacterium]
MNSVIESSFDKVFDTQKIFRVLLDVMARPGTMQELVLPPLNAPRGFHRHTAAIAFTLLDEATTFGLIPYNEEWERYIRLNTGACREENCRADYLIVQGGNVWPECERFNRGSLASPEKSSTLIVNVESITEEAQAETALLLKGPGIEATNRVGLRGLHERNIQAVKELNNEFPLGVDVILVDAAGKVCALPRSVRIDLEESC